MLNIIVVDDEVPIREWIVFSIDKQNKPFNVVDVASSGQEAYDLALRHKPDVIVTDIKMPGMDGIELMQAVKKFLPYTTFIILTNYADFTYAKKAITYGAREYFLKSEMRGDDLGQALLKILDEKKSIINQKQKDTLANGYVDLYSLYNEFEQEEYSRTFWMQYDIEDERPYQVLTLEEDCGYNQREYLLETLGEIQPKCYVIAIRHSVIYIIVQEEEQEVVEEKVQRLMGQLMQNTPKGIAKSRIHYQLDMSMKAIEESEQALGYTFFNSKLQNLSYLELCKGRRLNRSELREIYHEILNQIALKLYDKARRMLKNWFETMENIHIEDATWAKEICQRMMMSIEERFYQMYTEMEERPVSTLSLNIKIIQDECEQMLIKMSPVDGGSGIKPIDKAIVFIHDHYNQNISLAEVAQEVFLSPEYFSRLFKEEVGENFSVYLMMYRLKRAKELLLTTEWRIAEIAHEVGYGTPGYFSRIYKKYMGKTPECERQKE